MITPLFSLLLLIYPAKADVSLKFQDISLKQTLNLAKTFGVSTELPEFISTLQGRIKILKIEIRSNIVYIDANGFNLQNNSPLQEQPIRWLKIWYNRKTRCFYAKSEMLGGLVELEGIAPK